MHGRRPLRSLLCLFVGCLAVACLPRDRDVGRERPAPAEKRSGEPEKKPAKKAKNAPTKRPTSASASEDKAKTPDVLLEGEFRDDFERTVLGSDWRATSRSWRIQNGQLCAQGARNHPVWLARRLPVNAAIEFDATSHSADGDIKAEFWGDGRSSASGVSYQDATSYLTIFGGWKNHYHVLARLDEHAKDRTQLEVNAEGDDVRARPVVQGQRYHFKVVRANGKLLRWYVDDIEIHTLDDEHPLKGEGHEHFGFNDWEVRVCFDNLRVTTL